MMGNGSKFGDVVYDMSAIWSSMLELFRCVSSMGGSRVRMRLEKGGITHGLSSRKRAMV